MWFSAVYQAVQEIPYGKVTSYGHIARLLGYREPSFMQPCQERLTHVVQLSDLDKWASVSNTFHQRQINPTHGITATPSPGSASSTPRAQ